MAVHADSWLRRGEPSERRSGALASELFEQHSEFVLSVCRALLVDQGEAEDAMQQTFLYAYRSILSGREPRQPAAWLATIARNECLNRIRARTREPLVDAVSGKAAGAPDALNAAIAREDLHALGRTIRELPDQQREALLLHEFCGLPYSEVAATIGVSESAIGSLLFRARARLRSVLHRTYAALAMPAIWNAADHLFTRGPATASAVPVVAKLGTAAVAVGLTAGAVVVVDHDVQSHHRPPPPPAHSTSQATPRAPSTHVRRATVAAYLPHVSRPAAAAPIAGGRIYAAPPAKNSHGAPPLPAAAAAATASRPPAPPTAAREPHDSNASPRAYERSSPRSAQHRSARSSSSSTKAKGRQSHGRPSAKTHSNTRKSPKQTPTPKASKRASAPGSTTVSPAPGRGNGTPHDDTGTPSEPQQQNGNGAEGNGAGAHGNGHAHQGH